MRHQFIKVAEQYNSLCGYTNDGFDILSSYGLITPLDFIYFFAQAAHETCNFTIFEENLNYTPEGLLAIFPKYFNNHTANKYGRKDIQKADQAAIANIAYGGRMGNIQDGDGYKYRGRGIFQLTGRANYTKFSQDVFNDDNIVLNPYILTLNMPIMLHSAGWFWKKNDLTLSANDDNIILNTKLLNGGANGLTERTKLVEHFKQYFT